MPEDAVIDTDGAGVLDCLRSDDGDVCNPAFFLPGMKLRVLTPDMKHERGTVIIREVILGTPSISGKLTFEEKLPKGMRKGDLLVYLAPDPMGLDRALAPKEP